LLQIRSKHFDIRVHAKYVWIYFGVFDDCTKEFTLNLVSDSLTMIVRSHGVF